MDYKAKEEGPTSLEVWNDLEEEGHVAVLLRIPWSRALLLKRGFGSVQTGARELVECGLREAFEGLPLEPSVWRRGKAIRPRTTGRDRAQPGASGKKRRKKVVRVTNKTYDR